MSLPYTSTNQNYHILQENPRGSDRHAHDPTMIYNSEGHVSFRDGNNFEEDRRSQAVKILDSNELLIWFSSMRNESVPQTRLYFQKVAAGLINDPRQTRHLSRDHHLDSYPRELAAWIDDFSIETHLNEGRGFTKNPESGEKKNRASSLERGDSNKPRKRHEYVK